MAIIVNNIENLTPTIFITSIDKLEKIGISEIFLSKILSDKKNGIGVVRDNYFLIKTNALLRHTHPEYLRKFDVLHFLITECLFRDYKFLMISK